jgi:signal transduction histidine kinase
MNAWAVFKRTPIVVPFACIATVLMLFISEWAYFQSVSQLNALVAMDAVQTHIQPLRQPPLDAESAPRSAHLRPDAPAAKVEAAKAKLYQTLMTARIGMAVLSAISLMALFLYLRQAFSLKRRQVRQQGLIQMDHDRLEIEVAHRTSQLTELTHHLQTAREDERNRLARNLHDELGALLTSAKLDAARIKSRLAGTAPEALERLAHLVDTLNSSIALGRRIIEDLRPSTLGNLGLVPTLEILAREFSERSGLTTHCQLAPVQLDATAELMIYRLMQEAITNITKYAKAHQVWLSLSTDGGQVQASVRDDGVGFDTTVPPTSAYGLVGMRYRVEAEGGTLRVVSSPGEGTLIQVTLPQAQAL